MPPADAVLPLVARYGYAAVAGLVLVGSLGVPLPIQLLLVLLSAASGVDRGMRFPLLAALATAAAGAGDLLVYLLGRTGGCPLLRRLLRRWGKGADPARVARARLLLWRQGGLVILLTRFALRPSAPRSTSSPAPPRWPSRASWPTTCWGRRSSRSAAWRWGGLPAYGC